MQPCKRPGTNAWPRAPPSEPPGSVALTGRGNAHSKSFCRSGKSGSNIEQLIDELDLARDRRLAQDAVTAPDHSHDLEFFDGGVGAVLIVWKPRVGRITRLIPP